MSHNYNPKSLENLKLGALARYSGKERHAYTVKPETHQWLSSGGNASLRLDELVSKILNGELVNVRVVKKLEAEIAELKLKLSQ